MDPKYKIKQELWERGVLTWKLHETQMKVYTSLRALPRTTREAVVLISRRWGKSYLGVVMALEDCLQNPGKQVFIVGPDLKQTKRIITPLMKIITQDAPKGLIKQTKSDLTWRVGESTLLIGAFDTALESFRGLEAFSIYLEETGLANVEEFGYTMKSVLRPTLMHTQGRMTHLTTPPKEENHPFVFETMPAAKINDALFIYTIEDNPLLSKEDIEAEIRAAGGRESEHCKRELFCQIVQNRERLLTPEFDESLHVVEMERPKYAFYLTSIDFGGSMDPHATLLMYFDFERNRTCFYDEVWLPINTDTDTIIGEAKKMEEKHAVKWLKGQPERRIDAPDQLLLDINRTGYSCSKPMKGKDSVEDGLQAMRVAFIKNQIEIHPRCKVLIETFKYGMWDRNRKDFQRTEALGHCDAIAAASYGYRHIDRFNNPLPPNLGMSRDTHFFVPERQTNNEDVLNRAFFGEDD